MDADAAGLMAWYDGCPLCGHADWSWSATVDCTGHDLWHEPLPREIEWRRCEACEHLYTAHYWTEAGLAEVLRLGHDHQLSNLDPHENRQRWAPMVRRVVDRMGPHRTWLDVGCGNGSLVTTAAEWGFDVRGLDLRPEPVIALRREGYKADIGTLTDATEMVDVLSLCDVIEHVPDPAALIATAASRLYPGGMLIITTPNEDTAVWRWLNRNNRNAYWREIEHHHIFSRSRLHNLLQDCEIGDVRYDIGTQYVSTMEVMARR